MKYSDDTRTVQLRGAVSQLVQRFPLLSEVYLFGSRRHQTGSLRSDIDLLVRSDGAWSEPGVASEIWTIDPYLDVFASEGGSAVSLANGSRIDADDFNHLVTTLQALPLWREGDWCGPPPFELQVVLLEALPTYTNLHPTYVDGAPLLVMCALQEEFEAVCRLMANVTVAPKYFAEGGATVAMGSLPSGTATSVIGASLSPWMGNVSAALATLDAIDSLHPRRAVLTGIAAGQRGQARLGDVVIPEVIVGYEETKVVDGAEAFHGSMPTTQPELIAQIKAWGGADEWSERWTSERNRITSDTDGMRVRLLFDAMASGEKVLADSQRAKELAKRHRRIISFEMEAHGFSAACVRRGIPFLVIKGVTDYADAQKDDAFRDFACTAAADLVAELVAAEIL